MEGFVGVRESLRKITLLDSLVGPGTSLPGPAAGAELIAALALLFDALVDQLVDAGQRLFGTGIGLLLGSNPIGMRLSQSPVSASPIPIAP